MVEPEIYVGPLVVFVPPALLGQGGDFFGEVGVVVFIDHGDVTVFNFQLGHGGVVAVAHFAHLLRGDPQELGHGVADEGAVGEGGDGLVGVLGGDVQDGLAAPHPNFREAFAAGGAEVRGGGGEKGHAGVFPPVDPGPGVVLPLAHADLPQVRAGDEGQALGDEEGAGSRHGAEEVAGIDGVDGHVGEPVPQGCDLAVAVVGDETIILAVDAAVEIALRLGVTNEIECGHGMPPGTQKINQMITLHYNESHKF